MSDRPGLWFPLLLLTALALLTTWLDFEVRNNMTEAANRDRHDPDTLLYRFSSQQTNREGRVDLRLRAHTLRHFMDDGSSEMVAPEVEHRDRKGETIVVRSERGRSSGDRKTLDFEGAVVLRQSARSRAPVTLETAALRLLPEQRRASTDQPVRITSGGTLITAHGLDFDASSRTLHLRSRVKVTYPSASRHAAPVPAPNPSRPGRRAARRGTG